MMDAKTREMVATQMVMNLLKAHEEMVKNPGEWSKDSTSKEHYYGLLNRVCAAVERGWETDREEA